ncbi:MAG: Hsp20/alpha crystallin family protein [Tepidiphilus sp.]|nr:Hsp20/alpha crystallin family protein [Tepidiphilus sp.]MDD3433073.1 Hsp20/alpha crystallin family protein [Tepidiphilus sp.]
MSSVLEQWKSGLGQSWEHLMEGWRQLWERAAGALTRFQPRERDGEKSASTNLPAPAGGVRWAVLGADIYETDDALEVRVEIPGLDREDLEVEVLDGQLVIRGEKRLEREEKQGQYRLMQCAYGRFQRVIALPVPVKAEDAKAEYRDGVLKITLPKAETAKTRRIAVQG